MKRLVIILVAIFASVSSLSAQNYMVVNSEEVFKAIPAYNTALTQLETLSETYQKNVDAKFKEVESLYNAYVAKRNSLSADQRAAYESEILKKE